TTRNQSAVGAASAELSSGLRVNTPSDDPAAWLAAQRVKLHQALSQGAGAAATTSRERLAGTDNALASLGDIVSQIRTLAVQGSSDTYNAGDRAGIGAEARSLFLAALDAANAQGNDGEYLLAGADSLTRPFDAAGTYGGDATVRAVPSEQGVTGDVTIAGDRLTATHGVDVLPLLDRVATALTANGLPTLLAALPDLDTAVKQVASARSQTGAAMAGLDQASSARAALEQDMQQAISRLVEVDTVSAASELAKATQSLEVSRAVSSHILAVLAPSA
ncbi:MAG TPA: flagellin, partial [Kofleriaceae bacterium]|nr:flagellin [Kofleriaceae bacterium]